MMARAAKTIMIRVAVEALMPVVVSPVLEPAEEPPAELPPLPLLPEFRPELTWLLLPLPLSPLLLLEASGVSVGRV